MEERFDWFHPRHFRELWWIWVLFCLVFFLKWKYIRENYWFHSPRTVTLNLSSTSVTVFRFTWRPLIFKGNYFPPPQYKLHVRLFLGSVRLVSLETALQKGGKLGFIGGQLPFYPKLAVGHHNGISDAESSVRDLTGLDKCNIPPGSKAAFLYYLLLFTYLFYFEVEVALTQRKKPHCAVW